MSRYPRVHDELVLIDQSQFRQRQRERQASREQSLTRFRLELTNGRLQITAHELGVPVDLVQCARHDILPFSHRSSERTASSSPASPPPTRYLATPPSSHRSLCRRAG